MSKAAPTKRPPFTSIEEEAAVLIAMAITWRARDQKGPPTAPMLRRRAAIYLRWSSVFVATEQGLIAAAKAIEGSPKVEKAAKHGAKAGRKIGPAKRAMASPAAPLPKPKLLSKPPPTRRPRVH